MASIEKRITADGKTTYRAKVRKKGYPTETAKILIPCQNAPRSRASA